MLGQCLAAVDRSFSRRVEGFFQPVLSQKVADQIDPLDHEVALRLISGSGNYFREVASRQELITRRQYDVAMAGGDDMVPPSWAYRRMSLRHASANAMHDAWAAVRREVTSYLYYQGQHADPRDGQHPLYGVVGCVDSRVHAEKLLECRSGEALATKMMGGSLLALGRAEPDTDLNDFNLTDRLHPEALKFMTFCKSKKVETFILMTHGLCGAVEASHTHCCAQPARDLDFVMKDALLSADEKGKILIGESLRQAYDLVQKQGVDFYVSKMQPVPQDLNGDAAYLAMELALGLANLRFADRFFAQTDTRVVWVHMDLRSFNPYIYNRETGQIVAVTDHPNLPAPKTSRWRCDHVPAL